VAVVDKWPLFRFHIYYKSSKLDLKMVVVDRWSLLKRFGTSLPYALSVVYDLNGHDLNRSFLFIASQPEVLRTDFPR
jgi:hypothetical protein